MKKLILISVTLLFVPLSAYALVIGGNNQGFSGYSSHSCIKPIKPLKLFSFSSRWEIDSYNSRVDFYNSQRQLYLNCIEEYIENANNDIDLIKQKAKEASDEARY